MKEVFVKTPYWGVNQPFSIQHAGISYCDGSYKIFRQKSDLACIEYIIKGTGTVKTKKRTYTPKQGDSYLLLPDERHEYYSSADDPWTKIWVNVDGDLPKSLIYAYSLQNNTLFQNCNSKPYITAIHDVLNDTSLTPDEMLSKCAVKFHELIQFLAKHKDNEHNVPSDAEKLKDYIDTNIYSKITINDLARSIYKSPSQAIRIFKAQYDMTPYEYHLECRIQKAISLISNTNLSIRKIADELGFCDEHYFSSLFKNKTGKKPTDYRKFTE